jgi:hypothetical protein
MACGQYDSLTCALARSVFCADLSEVLFKTFAVILMHVQMHYHYASNISEACLFTARLVTCTESSCSVLARVPCTADETFQNIRDFKQREPCNRPLKKNFSLSSEIHAGLCVAAVLC